MTENGETVAKTVGRFPEPDALWYKDAILYELRVGAFQDSDGDGTGDFRGLAARLDYLQDLGITAVWLLPFARRRSATTATISPTTPTSIPTAARSTISKPSCARPIGAASA